MARITKEDLELRRTDLRYKSLWIVCSLATFSYCFHTAADAYVKLNSDPAWLKLALSILSLLIYFGAPTALYLYQERRFRRFVREVASRLSRLEGKIDPGRSSSQLLEDGTDPPLGTR